MKKGRHRRFEEARRLKQSGPSAEDLGIAGDRDRKKDDEDDFEDIARRYGVEFDENGEVVAEDDA